jgi:hypothetical protein
MTARTLSHGKRGYGLSLALYPPTARKMRAASPNKRGDDPASDASG